jgi:hypothetical protein
MKASVINALNKWEKRAFDYGDSDCCQFAGFIVRELTGKDYLAPFSYGSEEDAYSIIEKHGDLVSTASTVLGDPETDITNLDDGSPVVVSLSEGIQIMGIKLGDLAVCISKNGMVQIPHQFILSGWKLCHKPYNF